MYIFENSLLECSTDEFNLQNYNQWAQNSLAHPNQLFNINNQSDSYGPVQATGRDQDYTFTAKNYDDRKICRNTKHHKELETFEQL